MNHIIFLPFLQERRNHRLYKFQHEMSPIKNFLHDHGIQVLRDWASQSPDLNSIEQYILFKIWRM